jgi:hypothetical protein
MQFCVLKKKIWFYLLELKVVQLYHHILDSLFKIFWKSKTLKELPFSGLHCRDIG